MSEIEEEQQIELDQQEMQQFMKKQKKIEKKQSLKNWVVYSKLRGRKSGNDNYSQQMQQIGSFNHVVDFFKLHTAIKDASQLQIDVKLFYFLSGCQPLWEKWLDSGCLLFYIKYRDEQKDKLGCQVLNKTWEYLLYSLIGNSLPTTVQSQDKNYLEQGNQKIIGIVLSRRDKVSLIQVWFRSQKHSISLSRKIESDVRNKLKQIKDYQKSLIKVGFKLHKDSYNSHSTIKGSHTLKGLNSSF